MATNCVARYELLKENVPAIHDIVLLIWEYSMDLKMNPVFKSEIIGEKKVKFSFGDELCANCYWWGNPYCISEHYDDTSVTITFNEIDWYKDNTYVAYLVQRNVLRHIGRLGFY